MEYLKRAVCFFFFSLSFITIIYFYFYVDHSREVVLISLPYLAVFLLLAIFNFLRASEITVNEKNTLPPLSILYSNLPVYALAFFTTFAMIVNSDRGFGAIGTMLMACILAVLYTIITFVWYFFASKPMIGYENTLQNIFGFLLLAIVSSIPFISFLTSWTW